MDDVFKRFSELFELRYSKISSIMLGEDSVRYDFFEAIKKETQIKNWEINLEYPINKNAFISDKNEKSKREQNPQIDLYINSDEVNLIAEFGFFRRNSVKDSTINVTEKTFKMFNDIIRLALHNYFEKEKNDAYFVCVADEKMLDKGYNKIKLPKFPGEIYEITVDLLNEIKDKYKTSNETIQDKFLKKFYELNRNNKITISANLICEKKLNRSNDNLNAKILFYKITINKSK